MPCALVRVWDAADGTPDADLLPDLAAQPGTHSLGSAMLAITPTAGDPGIFDTAIERLSGLIRQDAEAGASAIVAAGELTFGVGSESPQLTPDYLRKDLSRSKPTPPSGGLFVTARVLHRVELGWLVEEAGTYNASGGPTVPLFKVLGPAHGSLPWRNRDLLGRRIRWTERQVEAKLAAFLGEPAALIEGPMGCGKSRAVWESLKKAEAPCLWANCRSPRSGGPSLAEQIFGQLLGTPHKGEAMPVPRVGGEFPTGEIAMMVREWRQGMDASEVWKMAEWLGLVARHLEIDAGKRLVIVCDDLQCAGDLDVAIIGGLLGSSHLGQSIQLVLVRRPGAELSEAFDPVARVAVGPLAEAEFESFSERLFEGLGLPPEVNERFLEAGSGFPWALEEGVLRLVRRKLLRQIYGSFFFNGGAETEYEASARLAQHLVSEATRLAEALPLQVLALAEAAVPPTELRSVAEFLGGSPAPDWESGLLESGLVRPETSPWGPGVDFCCPAYSAAIRRTCAQHTEAVVKPLGELLSMRSEDGEALWHVYRLLTGSEEAIEPLLGLLKTSYVAQLPRESLLEALGRELELLRQRGEDPKYEMRILWSLLQFARRMGILERYSEDLSRAVELAESDPRRLLALASLKSELEQAAGRSREAEKTLRHALSLAKGGDQRRQGLLLTQLGKILIRRGSDTEAAELFNNLLALTTDSGASAMAATCRYYLGNIALHQGRLEDALEQHTAALVERRRQNLVKQLGSSTSALGATCLAMGNYPKALEYYRESQEILEEYGREGETSFALIGVGRALHRLGDFTGAAKPLREALALRTGRDDVAGEAIARLATAENYLPMGQPDKALGEARKAHFDISMLSIPWLLAQSEQLLGRILLRLRQQEDAHRHLEAALALHDKGANTTAAAFDRAWLLELALERGKELGPIRKLTRELQQVADGLQQVDLAEFIDFQLSRGLGWLRDQGQPSADPYAYLKRAYDTVLRKAEHLSPEHRHRFLSGVQRNQEILALAAQTGMTLPGAAPEAGAAVDSEF